MIWLSLMLGMFNIEGIENNDSWPELVEEVSQYDSYNDWIEQEDHRYEGVGTFELYHSGAISDYQSEDYIEWIDVDDGVGYILNEDGDIEWIDEGNIVGYVLDEDADMEGYKEYVDKFGQGISSRWLYYRAHTDWQLREDGTFIRVVDIRINIEGNRIIK